MGNALDKDHTVEGQVGCGGVNGSWKLYRARRKKGGQRVTLMVFEKQCLSTLPRKQSDAVVAHVRAELAALKRIRHPNVLSLLSSPTETKQAIVAEVEPVLDCLASFCGPLPPVHASVRAPTHMEGHAAAARALDGGATGRGDDDGDGGGDGAHVSITATRASRTLEPLEKKLGVFGVVKAVSFLHTQAHVVHGNIRPEHVYVTPSGEWKVSGLGFSDAITGSMNDLTSSASSPSSSSSSSSSSLFDWNEHDESFDDEHHRRWNLLPHLDYVAPEVVFLNTACYVSDMFSLGALIWKVYTGESLLRTKGNVLTYKVHVERIHPLSSQPGIEHVPTELHVHLQQLLTADSESRLTASQFTSSTFFRDTLLRALMYVGSWIDKTDAEKVTFLSGLRQILPQLSLRLCERKVLRPVVSECQRVLTAVASSSPSAKEGRKATPAPSADAAAHHSALIVELLETLFQIVKRQTSAHFQLITFPVVLKCLQCGDVRVMYLLLKHLHVIYDKCELQPVVAPASGGDVAREDVVHTNSVHSDFVGLSHAMLCRAFEVENPKLHDMALRCIAQNRDFIRTEHLHADLLPRLLSLCIVTKAPSVRLNALVCLNKVLPRCGDDGCTSDILTTLKQLTSVCIQQLKAERAPAAPVGDGGREWAPTSALGLLERVVALMVEVAKGARNPKLILKRLIPSLSPLIALPALPTALWSAWMASLRKMVALVEAAYARAAESASSAKGGANALDHVAPSRVGLQTLDTVVNQDYAEKHTPAATSPAASPLPSTSAATAGAASKAQDRSQRQQEYAEMVARQRKRMHAGGDAHAAAAAAASGLASRSQAVAAAAPAGTSLFDGGRAASPQVLLRQPPAASAPLASRATAGGRGLAHDGAGVGGAHGGGSDSGAVLAPMKPQGAGVGSSGGGSAVAPMRPQSSGSRGHGVAPMKPHSSVGAGGGLLAPMKPQGSGGSAGGLDPMSGGGGGGALAPMKPLSSGGGEGATLAPMKPLTSGGGGGATLAPMKPSSSGGVLAPMQPQSNAGKPRGVGPSVGVMAPMKPQSGGGGGFAPMRPSQTSSGEPGGGGGGGGGGMLAPMQSQARSGSGGGGIMAPMQPHSGGGMMAPMQPHSGGGMMAPMQPHSGGGMMAPMQPQGGLVAAPASGAPPAGALFAPMQPQRSGSGQGGGFGMLGGMGMGTGGAAGTAFNGGVGGSAVVGQPGGSGGSGASFDPFGLGSGQTGHAPLAPNPSQPQRGNGSGGGNGLDALFFS